MLQISNFRKSYNGLLILNVPALQFEAGIHWLKGSNGSGKTTLFKSVAGMLPFEGEILLNNQYDLQKHPIDYRLRVNYGEAEPVYPEFLTAHDLIQFVGKAKQATQQQINELIETLEIGHFMRNPTGTYSSGMLKKTSLVLAFLGNPSVVMLDEPLITIDDQAVRRVYELIDAYYRRGVTFLLSSHQDFRFADLPIRSTFIVKDKAITAV